MIAARPLGVLVLCLGVAAPCLAQALPALTAPVNDFAHVIDPASASEMDRRIRALEAATHDAVVVVTVDTFAPYGSIEEYAVRLYEHAGIGQKGKDNGVLVLLAVKDRRARIEVGYDLEQFITDGFAGETIRQEMLPAFREQRYGQGLLAGSTRVIQRIAERRGVKLTDLPAPAKQESQDSPLWIIVLIIVVVLIIARASRRRGPPRFRGPWGGSTWSGWHGGIGGFGGGFGGLGGGFGGGGGGGFGGFGGGRSGGGGASGGW